MNEFLNDIFSKEITTGSAIFRLVVSMILGSAVGLERKLKGQTAGIRTFALISMGATLAMLLSIYVPQEYMGLKNGDPGRIAAQVISGIGFLGAGAIIQMKGSVRGLTTAAGIWMTATIGMSVGVGMYAIAVSASLLILVIFHLFERFEHKVSIGSDSRIIRLVIDTIVTDLEPYRRMLKENNIKLTNLFVEYDYQNNQTRLNLLVLYRETADCVAMFEDLRQLNPTRSISLGNQISI